jgi:predicted transcriptional regulator of viral defense system
MGRVSGLPTAFAQAPMRTIRPQDAATVYAHPGTQLARLVRRGLLHKVAVGYYVVVPQEHVGSDWRPIMEAAAAGIASAAVGPGRAVLMGLSAARLHDVVPRALGTAIVAVPDDRRDVVLRDRDGVVHFVQRDTEMLDAELMVTELGECLVTRAEQTVLDLAHRPGLGHAEPDAHAAIVALLPRCDEQVLQRLAGQQRLRAALARARRLTPGGAGMTLGTA